MELVAAAVGVVDITARASSKAWELCGIWKDAPRDIFQLRDEIDRSATFFLALHDGLSLLVEGCDAIEGLQKIIDDLIAPCQEEPASTTPAAKLSIPKRRKFVWLRRLKEVKKLKNTLNHVTSQIGFRVAFLNLSISAELPDDIRRSEIRLATHVDQITQASTYDITRAIESSTKGLEQHILTVSVAATQAVIETLVRQESLQRVAYNPHASKVSQTIEGQDVRLQEQMQNVLGHKFKHIEKSSTAFKADIEDRSVSQSPRTLASGPRPPDYEIPSTCVSSCKCTCHSSQSYGTWKVTGFRQIFGTFRISMATTLLRQRPCTDRMCRNQGREGHFGFQYVLPEWAGMAMISLFSRLPEPEMLIRVHRRHPIDAKSVDYQQSIFPPLLSVGPQTTEKVRDILACRPSAVLDVVGKWSTSPLTFAMIQKLTPAAKLLLQAGADPFQENQNGDSAVSIALQHYLNDEEGAKELVQLMPLDRYLDLKEFNTFHKVVSGFLPLTTQEAMRSPFFTNDLVNRTTVDGWTPLHLAAMRGDSAAVRCLLEAGAEVDPGTRDDTPFVAACYQGDDATINLLLHYGAKVDYRLNDGSTPLHTICFNQRATRKALQMLLEHCPPNRINATTSFGRTPLFEAVKRPDFLELLIAAGADVNAANKNGTLPLMACISPGLYASAELLLRSGADCTLVGVTGQGLLHWLAGKGDETMMDLFASYGMSGVDACWKDDNGMTGMDMFNQERKDATPELRAAFQRLLDTIKQAERADGEIDADGNEESEDDFADALESLSPKDGEGILVDCKD